MSKALQARRTDGGYALAEVTLALLLMGLIATLALPGLPRPGGPASLRATAYRIAALLRDERTAAGMRGHATAAALDPAAPRVQSSTGPHVDLPAGVELAVSGGAVGPISFSADGHSSGGSIVLQGAASRLAVIVNPDTGAIRVAAP